VTKAAENLPRPDLFGSWGRAWEQDIPAMRINQKVAAEADPSVGGWVIEAPWAHPAWHSYLLALIHLRPLAGFDPPIMYLQGATHEFILYALDPDHPRSVDQQCHLLTPANFAAQIICENDTAARDRIKAAIQEICDGKLSPDTDYMRLWVQRFGGNMLKKYPSDFMLHLIDLDGAKRVH
jgi:hypothetical protein